jgi:hypothetical protein
MEAKKTHRSRAAEASSLGAPLPEGMAPGGLLDRLLKEGIRAHAAEIAEIAQGSDPAIAVVVFEPDERGRRALRAWGWDGEAQVFALPHECEAGLAKADLVTARWVARRTRDVSRIVVIVQSGTFLMNLEPGRGLYIEPGSLDTDVN